MEPAEKKIIPATEMGYCDPFRDGRSGLLGNLELYQSLSLLLQDHGPWSDLISMCDVIHAQLHQVAGSQLAINTQIKKCEIPLPLSSLQAYTDRPNTLQFQT